MRRSSTKMRLKRTVRRWRSSDLAAAEPPGGGPEAAVDGPKHDLIPVTIRAGRNTLARNCLLLYTTKPEPGKGGSGPFHYGSHLAKLSRRVACAGSSHNKRM